MTSNLEMFLVHFDQLFLWPKKIFKEQIVFSGVLIIIAAFCFIIFSHFHVTLILQSRWKSRKLLATDLTSDSDLISRKIIWLGWKVKLKGLADIQVLDKQVPDTQGPSEKYMITAQKSCYLQEGCLVQFEAVKMIKNAPKSWRKNIGPFCTDLIFVFFICDLFFAPAHESRQRAWFLA